MSSIKPLWIACFFSSMLCACFGNGQDPSSNTAAASSSSTSSTTEAGSNSSSTGGSATGSASGTNGSSSGSGSASPQNTFDDRVHTEVTKSDCGPTDNPEKGFQGQVSLVERVAGFKGSNCNLKLVGQFPGDGASWQHASYKNCAYYGQAYSITIATPGSLARPSLKTPGVVVVDAKDPTHPKAVKYLQSPAMLDPWESLKVHEGRGLLAAVNGTSNTMGGPQFDVYDISKDCTNPVLLASVTMDDTTIKGHEGNWAPDGMTYYGGDLANKIYYAIDVADPKNPKYITKWSAPTSDLSVHGLSFSADSTRAYVALQGQGSTTPSNGFGIYDLTAIVKREKDPKVTLISKTLWNDGAWAQHSVPFKIKGHPYLVAVDEMGGDGSQSAANRYSTCSSGRTAFGIPRIFDIADETNPKLLSKLILEIGQLRNCAQATADVTTSAVFSYDSHYCSVDDPEEATLLACGYFNSGLRLFDIRDPRAVKEVGYYNPAVSPGYKAGSTMNAVGVCAGADWTSSRPTIVKDKAQIWFTSQCAGFQIVHMSPSIYPLK